MLPVAGFLTGCTTPISETALCSGLSAPMNRLNAAVVVEATDAVALAAQEVLSKFDDGCNM